MSRSTRQVMEVEGRQLGFTNLDKVFWPIPGYTKADLVSYLLAVSPVLLPHLADRPLVVTRYPEGIDGSTFYQKNLPAHAPEWITTFPYFAPHAERLIQFVVCREPATLAWLAQEGVIELHPWLSQVTSPEYPDFAIFDLDPSPPATFGDVIEVAFWVRNILKELGLAAYPKTSGATGLHLYVPIVNKYPYATIAGWVGDVADLIHRTFPGRTTRERRVARRQGVYIDHLQNVMGKTIASVYSPRPQPTGTVSTPVTWEELPSVHPTTFTINNVPDRVRRVGDLFAPVLSDRQNLDGPLSVFGRAAPTMAIPVAPPPPAHQSAHQQLTPLSN